MDQAQSLTLSFGLAKDLSVQLLTLSSALIGLTVVIAKDIKKTHQWIDEKILVAILLFYPASMVFGICEMMTLVGSAASKNGSAWGWSIDDARIWALLQVMMFGIATGLLVTYGIRSVSSLRTSETSVPKKEGEGMTVGDTGAKPG
jgi:hypothetical protein